MTELQVHLYKSHFTFSNQEVTFPYNGSLQPFIEAMDTLELNPTVISTIPTQYYNNGKVCLKVTDHRYGEESRKIELKPSGFALSSDINSFGVDFLGQEWTPDLGIQAESLILPILNPELDLDPNPDVCTKKSIENYNKTKYLLHTKKRKANDEIQKEKEELESQRKQDVKLLLLMDKAKDMEFYPRFSLLNFVEDWRKKKKLADEEQLIGLGDKQKIKLNSSGISAPRKMLSYNMNRKIMRTLRFETVINQKKTFTVWNVYDVNDGMYEGILRWGSQEGTAIDGDTLRYPIGNKQAVDYYVAHFRGFYGIRHKLVSDSASAVPLQSTANTLYPSQISFPPSQQPAFHAGNTAQAQAGLQIPITIKPSQ